MGAVGVGISPVFLRKGAGGPASSLLSGLVAYWKLDEASGNRVDASGNGHTATPVNAPGSAAGKVATAVDLELDSAQYLSVADHASLQLGTGSFTLALWMKPETTSRGGSFQLTVVSKGSACIEAMLYLDQLYAYVGGELLTAGGSLSAGTWYHVVVVRDGTACKLYRDNSQVATATNGADVSGAGVALEIGRRPGLAGSEFDGLIDECGIWSRALTSDERDELWNSGNGAAYPFV